MRYARNKLFIDWFQHYPIENTSESYSLTAYFLWPRDAQYTVAIERKIIQYILHRTESYFPGFKNAILGEVNSIPPQRYKEEYGMDSCLALRTSLDSLNLPHYNCDHDMYFIGNAFLLRISMQVER